jgi:hypothetical protein
VQLKRDNLLDDKISFSIQKGAKEDLKYLELISLTSHNDVMRGGLGRG